MSTASVIKKFEKHIESISEQVKERKLTLAAAVKEANQHHDAAIEALGDMHNAEKTSVDQHSDAVEECTKLIAPLKKAHAKEIEEQEEITQT